MSGAGGPRSGKISIVLRRGGGDGDVVREIATSPAHLLQGKGQGEEPADRLVVELARKALAAQRRCFGKGRNESLLETALRRRRPPRRQRHTARPEIVAAGAANGGKPGHQPRT